jgi:N-acetylmuramoyl-L-alanine amidase
MRKLLVTLLLCIVLLVTNCTKVKAEEITGFGVSLKRVDSDEVKTAFKNLKFTKKDVKIIYRIVEAECEGQSKEDKQHVTSIIINRLLSSKFGDTVKDIIFAKNQFSSIENGRYDNADIANSTIDAVDEVIEKGVTNEATYYANLKYVSDKMRRWYYDSFQYLFTDDANHSFFKER